MSPRPVRACSVGGCQSTEQYKIMFMVPKDEQRQHEWGQAVGSAIKAHRDYVCEDHFVLEEDTENWVKYRLMPRTRLILKKDAVPYRFGLNRSQSQFPGYTERFIDETGNEKGFNTVDITLDGEHEENLGESYDVGSKCVKKGPPERYGRANRRKQVIRTLEVPEELEPDEPAGLLRETSEKILGRKNGKNPKEQACEIYGRLHYGMPPNVILPVFQDKNVRFVPCACVANGRPNGCCVPFTDNQRQYLEPEITIKEEPLDPEQREPPEVTVKEEPLDSEQREPPEITVKEEPLDLEQREPPEIIVKEEPLDSEQREPPEITIKEEPFDSHSAKACFTSVDITSDAEHKENLGESYDLGSKCAEKEPHERHGRAKRRKQVITTLEVPEEREPDDPAGNQRENCDVVVRRKKAVVRRSRKTGAKKKGKNPTVRKPVKHVAPPPRLASDDVFNRLFKDEGDSRCVEPEMTVKEPGECTYNLDFPLVLVKQEPAWGEDSDLRVNEKPAHEDALAYTPSSSSNPDPSDDSEFVPDDDSDEDPDYGIDSEEEAVYNRHYISDGTYICHWCSKEFTLRRRMKYHLYKEHSGEKPYACNKCDFRAKWLGALRNHKFTKHSVKKRFACKICQKRFATKNHRTTHTTHVHTKRKRFSCSECDFRTNYSSHFKTHCMRHTGEKPLQCKVCQTRFLHSFALTVHMRIHTGEKPYACDLCDYRCRQIGMLTAHKRVHHPEENGDSS